MTTYRRVVALMIFLAVAGFVGWLWRPSRPATLPAMADSVALALPAHIVLPLQEYADEELRTVPGTLEQSANGYTAQVDRVREERIVVDRADLDRLLDTGTAVPVPEEPGDRLDIAVDAGLDGRLRLGYVGPRLPGWTLIRTRGPQAAGRDIKWNVRTAQEAPPTGHYLRFWIFRDNVILECPRRTGACSIVALRNGDGTIRLCHGREDA
jgi:hypothetical protein